MMKWLLFAISALCCQNPTESHVIMETHSSKDTRLLSQSLSRRGIFHHIFGAVIATQVLTASPPSVRAEVDANGGLQAAMTPPKQGGKPYAPMEALMPAMRCKIWIDKSYSLSSKLSSVNDNTELKVQLLNDLNTNLSNRPQLFVGKEKPLQRLNSGAAAGQITAGVSTANKGQYQKNRESLSMPNKMAAMLNQADVERQWGMLQYESSQRDKANSIRAAFSFYTQQLVFGDSYLLTASKADKKRMIRNDELPSLTAVITSDLDLRDLYRNQLLTAIDDAQAEVAYQVKQPANALDLEDTIDLMNQAHTACEKWFDLISPEDIKEAYDIVANET